ncbi:MAG TPA: YifB family Mg chelatase-like AAA ATPase, partial [Nitrospirota bacterium]
MLSKVSSSSVMGIDAFVVDVEVDVAARGLPFFSVVGLPDAAVKESKDRVRAALKNNGFEFPLKQIVINLAPANIKKEGSSFDLPIALGIIAAEGLLEQQSLNGYIIAGELSLDGKIKPVRGALSMAVKAKEEGCRGLVIPEENADEAAVVADMPIYGVKDLAEVVEFFRGAKQLSPRKMDVQRLFSVGSLYLEDFAEVKGQEHVKRALEIAAAGGHNILMIGPPGSGKTMLARRLVTVLPEMSFAEAIETTKIHSVMGLISPEKPLVATRPFRSPHHTISDAGLVGGGANPKPGEASLSHNGVLFLDELPEFHRNALEVLRQPLEDRSVTISRAMASITYPASFMLVAAMNPCPCGFYSDPTHQCTCNPQQIQRYRAKVSGPLLDRIDIHVEVPPVKYRELASTRAGEPSASVRARVNNARSIQRERFAGEGIYCNSQMKPRQMKKACEVEAKTHTLLENAVER